MPLNFIGGLLGAGASYAGARAQARATDRASQRATQLIREGRDAFAATPAVTTYMPGGADAFRTRQALLGLGGDPAAAREAFNNYLGSTDFNFRLGTGRDAITGSRAARGILNSGRTGTALADFGQELGSRYMNNYLGQLQADSQLGLNANQTYGNVLTGGASQMAQIAQGAGDRRADAIGSGFSGVAGGLGQALGSKTAGRLYNRFFGG